MLAIKSGGSGDITARTSLWRFDSGPTCRRRSATASCSTSSYRSRRRLRARRADRRRRLRPRAPAAGTYSASPVLADGKIYVTSEEGVTSVYRAGPKFELLAENPSNDYCLSSIAVSDGQIFLRTTGHLWAIGQRRKAST